jgi:hypothetical protein
MSFTHSAKLDIPHLSPLVCRCHIVSELITFSVVSIGQLCDVGCNVLFSTRIVNTGFRNTVIMKGMRARDTGLWLLDLTHHEGSHRAPQIMLTLLIATTNILQEVNGSIPWNRTSHNPALVPLQEMFTYIIVIGSTTLAVLVTIFSMLPCSLRPSQPWQQPLLMVSSHNFWA